MQSDYKMLNRTISETDCLRDGSDVDEDDRKSSGVIDYPQFEPSGKAKFKPLNFKSPLVSPNS